MNLESKTTPPAFTILLVDADPKNRQAIAGILTQAGYTVIPGINAEEAVSLARIHHPELVLLDVGLPDGDGRLVARQLKSDPELAGIFVLLLSSFRIQEEDLPGGLQDGLADGYLVHPISPPVLCSWMEVFLRLRTLQQLLREKEERYRFLIESSKDVTWTLDVETQHFTYVSPSVQRLCGYTPEEVMAQPIYATLLPEKAFHVRQIIEERVHTFLLDEKSVRTSFYTKEIQQSCKDGSIVWTEVTVSYRRNPKNGRIEIYGVSRDITERKQLEELEREKAARQQREAVVITAIATSARLMEGTVTDLAGEITEAAVRAIHVGRSGVWLLDPDGTSLVNIDTYEATSGKHQREALLAEHEFRYEFTVLRDTKYVDADQAMDDPRTAGYMEGYLKPNRILSRLDAMIRLGGEPVGMLCFESVGKIHRWEEDEIFFACQLADQLALAISNRERRQTEQMLLESESRLRAITQSARDAILMMAADGTISFWNPAAERLFGYRSAEVVGQDLHLLIAPTRYHKAFRSKFPDFQRTGQGSAIGTTVTLDARQKNGTEIMVELSLSTIQIDGVWHAVGILRDITDRKDAERKLVQFAARMEQKTIELDAAILKADEANRAKGEFLANMSHEIRTPMNGVIGMTGLLLETELTDKQRQYAETLQSSGESLLTLINDILDFSKIEAGKLELETLDFDLRSLLGDLSSTLALRAQEKGIELLCKIAVGLPYLLRGDPGRLRQILTNLTGNAIKFTSMGEVLISASPLENTERDVWIRFSVHDTGIGIPADKIKLVFDKFSQVDTSVTRHYGGTGLGLAISKQLVELMGGEVGVRSKEGEGSEFWFTLRLEKQAGGEELKTLSPDVLTHVRTLIVDDSETNREVLIPHLLSWGMRTEEARNGTDALQALHRTVNEGDPFQIALIDMQMPGMDGETLGWHIREDNRLADTRLVLLTSLGIRGDAARLEKIGFSAYVTKPVRTQELKTILTLVLTARRGQEVQTRTIATRHKAREMAHLFSGRMARILLAEDNHTNQQVALGILKKLGLHADAVANGAEAVKAIESIAYDLVLMDIQMPEMDGLEATCRIRQLQSVLGRRRVPIIAMTAHAISGDREKCLQAGMDDYVSKPVNPQLLAKCLDIWLPKRTVLAADPVPSVLSESSPSELTAMRQESDVPVFDKAGFLARLMNDEELVRTVVYSFLNDIPDQIRGLKSFLDTGDLSGAKDRSHRIKGAAANVGGERLHEVAEEIEARCKRGDLTTARERVIALDVEFDRLKDAMKQEVPGWEQV